MAKKTKSVEKIASWCIFLIVVLFTLLFVGIGIYNSLLSAGMAISLGNFIIFFFVTILLIAVCEMSKELNIIPVNNYFIIAVVLSWIILFVGFTTFSDMYKVELPIIKQATLGNKLSFDKITNNGSNSNIFFPLVCTSQDKKEYLSQNDVLICNITTNLNQSDYYLSVIKTTKNLINYSSESDISPCNEKGTCTIYLFLKRDSAGFFISPEYTNGIEKINPIFYSLEIGKLRDWKDLDNLEQNKMTLLIAIITASLLTAWACVYYSKSILSTHYPNLSRRGTSHSH